jgi:hypothetical protein
MKLACAGSDIAELTVSGNESFVAQVYMAERSSRLLLSVKRLRESRESKKSVARPSTRIGTRVTPLCLHQSCP